MDMPGLMSPSLSPSLSLPYSQLGLRGMAPSGAAEPQPSFASRGPVTNLGLMAVKSLAAMQFDDAAAAARARADIANAQPLVQSIASHIQKCWSLAKLAKQAPEQAMIDALRSRRGEYDERTLQRIRQQGGSEIYMLLFATKARQAKALLVDVLIGSGADKSWTISPTPAPNLPPDEVAAIVQAMVQEAAQAEMMGMPMTTADIRQRLLDASEELTHQIEETAQIYAQRAERKIEDQLVEGGWIEAINQFLDDLMVYKTAFIKGPVVRNAKQLRWGEGPDGRMQPQVTSEKKLEWERVDPLNIYPAPWCRTTQDGFLIERQKLSRSDLLALSGIEGYSDDAIRAVLDMHGSGGLHEWLSVDSQRDTAEGRELTHASQSSDLMDALQFWGSVSGKMLREWGMDQNEVPDEAQEYDIEAWLIGSTVIKAVLNPDPLGRRPYFSDGFSRLPGSFWHNSLFDVTRDCQDMCNSSARALANNLGISSGPQVAVNVDRLPIGESITQMFPWKVWQFSTDPMGSSAPAIDFFQPNSNAGELMAVFQRFSDLADDYSGIPKYMTGGTGGTGGAGRTASGLSMMLGNASKQIKQLVGSIDIHVVGPAIERAYEWNMQFGNDPDIKGDLQVQARGALSLVTKEMAQMRRQEFLMATGNPVDMQIIGMDGRAELLREATKGLNMNPDKVVPSVSRLKQRAFQAQLAAQQMLAGQQDSAPGQPALPDFSGLGPAGGGTSGGRAQGSGQTLMNGTPTVDYFSPLAQR